MQMTLLGILVHWGKRVEFTNHLTVHKPFLLSVPFSRGNPHTRVLSPSGPVHKGGSPTVQVTTGNLTDIALSFPTLHNALGSLLLCPFVQAASSFIPVCYTQQTLPTKREVEKTVVAVT